MAWPRASDGENETAGEVKFSSPVSKVSKFSGLELCLPRCIPVSGTLWATELNIIELVEYAVMFDTGLLVLSLCMPVGQAVL